MIKTIIIKESQTYENVMSPQDRDMVSSVPSKGDIPLARQRRAKIAKLYKSASRVLETLIKDEWNDIATNSEDEDQKVKYKKLIQATKQLQSWLNEISDEVTKSTSAKYILDRGALTAQPISWGKLCVESGFISSVNKVFGFGSAESSQIITQTKEALASAYFPLF